MFTIKIFFARKSWLRFNRRICRWNKWQYLHDSEYTYKNNEKENIMDMT